MSRVTTRLSDEPTGMCPCGCDRTAYAYTVPGLAGGYIDAAPECAERLALGASPEDFFACPLCGQHIYDGEPCGGKPCGCGARR